ncbi:soma ferritin-like isoform X2 [Ptychodera flava]|uniref:soma ferritin-like isoform X2 n=1 Tax=Ptychodera flava TaxID=63121 RepID=UPI00396A72C0
MVKFVLKLVALVLLCSLVSADSDSRNENTHFKKRKTSLCRQNYRQDSEDAINDQINLELYASHVYMSMSYYFDRDDVALPGFAKFFKKSSDEEREHAEKLLRFQNQRGGKVRMKAISQPTRDDWGTGRDAMWHALELEKEVNEKLLEIEGLATQEGDPHMADFITENFLIEQVESIEELSRHVTNLDRVGTGLGEYMYDKETLGED